MLEYKRIFNLKMKNIYFLRILKAIFRRIFDIPEIILWNLPFGYSNLNKKRLQKFKNIHKNKRVFIIANGPSLNKINFTKLNNEITIGMNRGYLLKDKIGFSPTYLVSIANKTQLGQFCNDFDDLDMVCFFNWSFRNKLSKRNNQYFIKERFSPKFIPDITKRIGSGKTVTYACLQLAFYMGFKEVFLIGKDHSYNTKARTGTFFTSDGKENNHFIAGYYKSGMVWDAPDYETEEFVYKVTKDFFECNNRKIFDATIDGKLNIFNKVDYNKLF